MSEPQKLPRQQFSVKSISIPMDLDTMRKDSQGNPMIRGSFIDQKNQQHYFLAFDKPKGGNASSTTVASDLIRAQKRAQGTTTEFVLEGKWLPGKPAENGRPPMPPAFVVDSFSIRDREAIDILKQDLDAKNNLRKGHER